MILQITRKRCKHLVVQIPEIRNDQLAWDVTISAAIQLHCLAMTLLPNSQNLQKVETDIVIFNGNVLGHAWHTWCKKGTNGKKMSCSLLICHMQIFNSIDFRTMGLWKWITFILIHTVYEMCKLVSSNSPKNLQLIFFQMSSLFGTFCMKYSNTFYIHESMIHKEFVCKNRSTPLKKQAPYKAEPQLLWYKYM